MKPIGSSLLAAALAVISSPALAQAASDAPASPPAPPYGYGPMWGYGYHHMWGWGFHPFGSILFAVLCVLLIVWAIRMVRFGPYGYGRFRHAGPGHWHGTSALDILEERFAKGEIDKNEFEEKRKLLMR